MSIFEIMWWMTSVLPVISDLATILRPSIFIAKCWKLFRTWKSGCFKLFQSSHPYNNLGNNNYFRYRLTRVIGFVFLHRLNIRIAKWEFLPLLQLFVVRSMDLMGFSLALLPSLLCWGFTFTKHYRRTLDFWAFDVKCHKHEYVQAYATFNIL